MITMDRSVSACIHILAIPMAIHQTISSAANGSAQYFRQCHKIAGNGLKGIISQFQEVQHRSEKHTRYVIHKPIAVCKAKKHQSIYGFFHNKFTIAISRNTIANNIGVHFVCGYCGVPATKVRPSFCKTDAPW